MLAFMAAAVGATRALSFAVNLFQRFAVKNLACVNSLRYYGLLVFLLHL